MTTRFLSRRWTNAGALLLAAGASLATSQPRQARNFPAWETRDGERDLGCAHASAYVAKTGKEGFGLTVRLDASTPSACPVQLAGATATIGGARVVAAELPPAALVPPGAPAFLYLPFAFDNEAAWNDGRRAGTLELVVRVGGREDTWQLPIVVRFDGFHRMIDRRIAPAPSAPVLERAGDAPEDEAP